MSKSEQIFLVVIILNTIIAIAYLLWGILAHKKNDAGENKRLAYIIRAVCMFICPVIGIVFFLSGSFINLVFFKNNVDLDDVVFSKEKVRQLARADEEREKNIVPIQDALAVSDYTKLRRLMLDVLKGNIDSSLASIAMALNSEDSETSHYAASVLSKALNEFRVNVRKLEQQLDSDEENCEEYARLMIEYMDQVLSQQVFTEVEQEYFVKMMEKPCLKLLERDNADGVKIRTDDYNYYAVMAKRFMEIKDYDKAGIWCEKAFAHYPETVKSYKVMLQYLFVTENKKEFLKVLKKLRASGIPIDNETLEIIRIFN